MEYSAINFDLARFNGSIIDSPLKASQVLDSGLGMYQFFPGAVMPLGHAFLVESYALKMLDTEPTFRDLALALAFCDFKFVIQARELEARLSGADFLDFIRQDLINRPAYEKIVVNEKVVFGVTYSFTDLEAFEKIKGKKLEMTLYGKHFRKN
jgi:hypothetical protein